MTDSVMAGIRTGIAMAEKPLSPAERAEILEVMARAIYYADPNFHGWGAVPKDEIYWREEPNKQRTLDKAEAALTALLERYALVGKV